VEHFLDGYPVIHSICVLNVSEKVKTFSQY
jgi:hypothetical protein